MIGSPFILLSSSLVGCLGTEKPNNENRTANQTQVVISVKPGWSIYTTNDGLGTTNRTYTIVQDDQGVLWAGGDSSLSRFDGNRWEIYPDAPAVDGWFRSAAKDKNGNLWFATGGGAYEFTDGKWKNYTPDNTDNGLPGINVRQVFVDNTGNIWFATEGNLGARSGPIEYGVTRYDGKSWKSYLGGAQINDIFQDDAGNMWFATNVGATLYDGTNFRTFTTDDGLAQNYVFHVCQDNQGGVWFNTGASGTTRYDGTNWQTFGTADGLTSNIAGPMLKDKQGNLWFLSYSGISRFDGTRFDNYDPLNGGAKWYQPYQIHQDASGNIWFATSVGLVVFNPG